MCSHEEAGEGAFMGHLESLYETIGRQSAQLVLALAVLDALGFDLQDFSDLLS